MYTEEILIEKEQRDKIQEAISSLHNDIENEKVNNDLQTAIHLGEQKEQIARLKQQMADDKAYFRAKQAEMDMVDYEDS